MHCSRRQFVQLLGLAATGLAAPRLAQVAQAAASGGSPAPTADDVLQRLLEGNRRFVKGELAHPDRKPEDFAPLAEGQRPVAAIVGCADSRVPPEILFDQGIGDLFVVRIAGNVVEGAGPSVKGSIEYAVAELGVPLVVVLGHSQCGAVKAALAHIEAHDALPGAIKDLVALIRPAVARIKGMPGNQMANAITENVRMGVQRLKTLQPILAPRVTKGTLKVVGATYELRDGSVTLLSEESNAGAAARRSSVP
jgi:carbonic anhydrase